MGEVTAQIVARSFVDLIWQDERLRGLKLPVRDVELDLLRWRLDERQWRHGDRLFAVTPNEVRRQPSRYPQQWRRVWRADLRYPLDALFDDGRWTVLGRVASVASPCEGGPARPPDRSRPQLDRTHLEAIRVPTDR